MGVKMSAIQEGDLLWEPSAEKIASANLTRYMAWLQEKTQLDFQNYQDLWRWSVTELELFWETMWDYFDIIVSKPYTSVLTQRKMPGAFWFVGAELNYAQNLFRHATTDHPAIIYKSETGPLIEVSWQELYDKTAKVAHALKSMGVRPGDRVVAYLPNIPETVIAFLATASLGAIWSSCSPDFGSTSVLERFTQIEPTVLFAVDGYGWGGKQFGRRDVVAELQEKLPTLKQTILISQSPLAQNQTKLQNTILWDDILAEANTSALEFVQVPFSHPLWVLYSSGTTGLPKPIVHSQGGIILEHVKTTHFHLDLKPQDRFFWFTSTGWMMWNFLVGGLLNGTTIILYNGSPAYPNLNALWQLVEESGVTYFGTGAAHILACIKAGIQPRQDFNLNNLRAVSSTGSPLPINGFQWVYENVKSDLALVSFSGGTDLCNGFVGGIPLQPIYAGEIQGSLLGANVQAFNEAGQPVVDEVGELVITEPSPSMPLYFWNDPENIRYKESYFEMFPGIWRHGDWIKINQRNGCVIYGRSDSTINRQGIRMGTSEIYRIVESFDVIVDSLIIDLEMLGRESKLLLFVVLRDDTQLDEDLQQKIKHKLRQEVSPRHVPNEIIQIQQVPYTLSGKKMEVPIRKILLGMDVSKSINPGAMRNPEAIDFFVDYATK